MIEKIYCKRPYKEAGSDDHFTVVFFFIVLLFCFFSQIQKQHWTCFRIDLIAIILNWCVSFHFSHHLMCSIKKFAKVTCQRWMQCTFHRSFFSRPNQRMHSCCWQLHHISFPLFLIRHYEIVCYLVGFFLPATPSFRRHNVCKLICNCCVACRRACSYVLSGNRASRKANDRSQSWCCCCCRRSFFFWIQNSFKIIGIFIAIYCVLQNGKKNKLFIKTFSAAR